VDPDLKDKVVLVTGSSKGIGRSIAFAFALEGCKVVVSARDSQSVEKTAAEIRKSTTGAAHGIPADVTVAADVERLVSETVRHCVKFPSSSTFLLSQGFY
jgi:NAD(P)-dependent dehydrogenase (short-subunit alcohol dehydrogenase family)